jgi:hypothetical protein
VAEGVMQNAQGLFENVVRDGEGWLVDLARGATVRDAVNRLNSLDVPLATFSRVQPSLQEIFVKQVGHASNAPRHEGEAHD